MATEREWRSAADRAYANGAFIAGAEGYPPRWEAAAAAFRHQTKTPLTALRALPALWDEKGKLALLPGLFYAEGVEASAWRLVFAPRGGGLPPG